MGIISGPGSFGVQFGDHLRSWDHLRTRTVPLLTLSPLTKIGIIYAQLLQEEKVFPMIPRKEKRRKKKGKKKILKTRKA